MKIITRLTDDQLSELYSEYNYDNMIIYDANGYEYPYYVIPSILALGDITLSEYNLCSKSKDGWVYSRSYGEKHLIQMTGLTFQELFDLTVLHINDTNDRPKCSNCGTQLKWSRRFTAGYGSGGHLWSESNFHFCCRSCAAEYQMNHGNDYPITKEFLDSGGTFGNMSMDIWIPSMIRSRRTRFINLGNPTDTCYLYVTWTDSGKFKFGVTQFPESRDNSDDRYWGFHIIKRSDRISIANIEANIKLKLNSDTEFLESQNLINKFWTIIKDPNLANWE